MNIVKAIVTDAREVGYLHATAWKQAYAGVFSEEYLNADTPDHRKQEFLEANARGNVNYYLAYVEKRIIGIAKVVVVDFEHYDISAIYILQEYQNKGYGTKIILYLKGIIRKGTIELWVLERNVKARGFYENNGFKITGKTKKI